MKKTLTFFLFIFFILILGLSNFANAISYLEDFNDDFDGEQAQQAPWFESVNLVGAQNYVTSDFSYSGLNSYQIGFADKSAKFILTSVPTKQIFFRLLLTKPASSPDSYHFIGYNIDNEQIFFIVANVGTNGSLRIYDYSQGVAGQGFWVSGFTNSVLASGCKWANIYIRYASQSTINVSLYNSTSGLKKGNWIGKTTGERNIDDLSYIVFKSANTAERRLYIDDFITSSSYVNETFQDDLKILPSKLGNKVFSPYETVKYVGSSSDILTTNSINIYKQGYGNITEQGFPKNVNSNFFSGSYTPNSTGIYFVTLYRGSQIKNVSFTVSGVIPNYYLYTSPNPSDSGDIFKLFYKFNDTDLTRKARISFYKSSFYPGGTEIKQWYISPNITGNFDISYSGSGVFIFSMDILDSFNQTISTAVVYSHIISSITGSNFIEVYHNPYYYSESYTNQVISYQHSYEGLDVWILFNGYKIHQNIGNSPSASVAYKENNFNKEGDYTVSLVIETADGYFYIDEIVFTVILSEKPKDAVDITIGGDVWNYIIALIIILAFVIAPVLLFKNNPFFIQNGTIVVSIFCIIGLGLTVVFELIDLWIAFLIALISCGMLGLKIYQIMEEKYR